MTNVNKCCNFEEKYMTDKEKVIQLLLDNCFVSITSELFRTDELTVSINTDGNYLVSIFPLRKLEVIKSYRELVGFLYLKYGKVNITK